MNVTSLTNAPTNKLNENTNINKNNKFVVDAKNPNENLIQQMEKALVPLIEMRSKFNINTVHEAQKSFLLQMDMQIEKQTKKIQELKSSVPQPQTKIG